MTFRKVYLTRMEPRVELPAYLKLYKSDYEAGYLCPQTESVHLDRPEVCTAVSTGYESLNTTSSFKTGATPGCGPAPCMVTTPLLEESRSLPDIPDYDYPVFDVRRPEEETNVADHMSMNNILQNNVAEVRTQHFGMNSGSKLQVVPSGGHQRCNKKHVITAVLTAVISALIVTVCLIIIFDWTASSRTAIKSPTTDVTEKNLVTLHPAKELTYDCITCICKNEGCQTGRCYNNTDGPPSCGPYRITEPYWIDCGRPGTSWKSCTTQIECSERCVKAYMARYGTYCTGGREPTCKDYTLIHKGGPGGCNSTNLGHWYGVQKCCDSLGGC